MRTRILLLAALALSATQAVAQQRIGYIDSDAILEEMPEYQSAQQRLDGLIQEWQGELERLGSELADLEREYEARALLFTDEERVRRDRAIQGRCSGSKSRPSGRCSSASWRLSRKWPTVPATTTYSTGAATTSSSSLHPSTT